MRALILSLLLVFTTPQVASAASILTTLMKCAKGICGCILPFGQPDPIQEYENFLQTKFALAQKFLKDYPVDREEIRTFRVTINIPNSDRHMVFEELRQQTYEINIFLDGEKFSFQIILDATNFHQGQISQQVLGNIFAHIMMPYDDLAHSLGTSSSIETGVTVLFTYGSLRFAEAPRSREHVYQIFPHYNDGGHQHLLTFLEAILRANAQIYETQDLDGIF